MHFIRRIIGTNTRNSNDGISHLIDRSYIAKQQRLDQHHQYRHHQKVYK